MKIIILSPFAIFLISAILLQYFLSAYPLYKMYKLANLKNPKFAFIPFIQSFKTYNLANFSMWTIFLLGILSMIPILGSVAVLIISFVVQYKIFENFGFKPIWAIISFFCPVIAYWYIALTNRPFVGNINGEFRA